MLTYLGHVVFLQVGAETGKEPPKPGILAKSHLSPSGQPLNRSLT